MDESAISSVYPSGFAFATVALPVAPAAPGLFSMMTRCFNTFSIANAVGRAVMSATPPGGNATTIVTGRDGYASCANTGTGRSARAINAIRRRIFFLRMDVLFSGTIIGARAPGVKRRRRLCDPIEFPSDHEPARDRYLHRFLLGRGKPRRGPVLASRARRPAPGGDDPRHGR